MSSGVIDLSIRRAEKLSRQRLIARICVVIAAAVMLLAMTFLPDPARNSTRGLETRKGGAPAVSERNKPAVDTNPAALSHRDALRSA